MRRFHLVVDEEARPFRAARDPDTWDYSALRAAAAPFGVSAEAFLRRLVTLSRARLEFYQARRPEFLTAYEQDEQSKSTGGNW